MAVRNVYFIRETELEKGDRQDTNPSFLDMFVPSFMSTIQSLQNIPYSIDRMVVICLQN